MYEGMFLFPQAVAERLQDSVDHVHDLLKRAGAEVVSFRKWDERRLAYEIKGNKRGVFFLAFFRADPTKMVGLERDCNLSEQLLRALITRADHMPMEQIEAADGRAQLADEIKLRTEGRRAEAAEPPAAKPEPEAAPAATREPAKVEPPKVEPPKVEPAKVEPA